MVQLRLVVGRPSRDDGAVLPLLAVGMVLFFGLAALVVDISNVHQERQQAQSTADSAALAAAQDLPDQAAAIDTAKEYALRNYGVAESAWASCVDPDALPLGTPCISFDAAGTLVRVRVPDRPVAAFFAGVVGKDSFLVQASATAERVAGAPAGPAEEGGEALPTDEQRSAAVRGGDPGGGYPVCGNLPDWEGAGGEDKWTEGVFVFEHTDGSTTTLCNTNRFATSPFVGNTAWLPEAGGSTVFGTGMAMHVSCSDIFEENGGWASKDGPVQTIDTEWRILRYTMVKHSDGSINKSCGEDFGPIYGPGIPAGADHIRLVD